MDDLEILYGFYKEGEATEEEVNEQYAIALETIDEVEFQSTLNQPEDELNCILTINSGAGGTESCDWCQMLMRMYLMWAEKANFSVRELGITPDA